MSKNPVKENNTIRNKLLLNIILKIEKMVKMLKNLNKYKRIREQHILDKKAYLKNQKLR